MKLAAKILNRIIISKPQRKFLLTLFTSLLTVRDKVNFRNLSRYGTLIWIIFMEFIAHTKRYRAFYTAFFILSVLLTGCISEYDQDKLVKNEKRFSLMEIPSTQGDDFGAVHSVWGLYSHSNPNALVYREGNIHKLLVAYQESDFATRVTGCDPYMLIIDLFTLEQLGPYKIGDTLVKGDPHGGPAIFLDNAGYVHIFYGSHHSSQLWTRTKKKISENDFMTGTKYSLSDFESPKTIGENFTYPQLVYSQDIAWMFTRGPFTRGPRRKSTRDLYVQRCINPQRPWNELNFDPPVQLTEFSGFMGVTSGAVLLRSEPVTDSNGNIHIIFSWRDNHHLNTQKRHLGGDAEILGRIS